MPALHDLRQTPGKGHAIGPSLPLLAISAIIVGFPESQHETHLPTLQSAPRTHPWLPGPHEDPGWSCCHQRTPRQRPQAPGCLKLQPQLPGIQVQRLKTRAQFQAVLAGATVARTAHFALHRTALDVQPPVPAAAVSGPEAEGNPPNRCAVLFVVQGPWMGALIPKRWAKRAVTRNAIKRQIYAVSSEFESRLTPAAHVVRLRSTFDRASFPSASSDALKRVVRGELEQLFARAPR